MKNIFTVTVLTTLMLASCKKDYTCECRTSFAGQTSATSSIINGNKRSARKDCENRTQSVSFSGFTTEVKCEIK